MFDNKYFKHHLTQRCAPAVRTRSTASNQANTQTRQPPCQTPRFPSRCPDRMWHGPGFVEQNGRRHRLAICTPGLVPKKGQGALRRANWRIRRIVEAWPMRMLHAVSSAALPATCTVSQLGATLQPAAVHGFFDRRAASYPITIAFGMSRLQRVRGLALCWATLGRNTTVLKTEARPL